jgi:hypothetical protein
MHPLLNDLSKLKDDELHKKFGELQKRFQQCYRFGPASAIPQLQMIIGDYQAEISRRNQKIMDDMMKKSEKEGKNFNGIIDIQ